MSGEQRGFMGLAGLGSIEPIPGTAAHPESWSFPTRSLPVQHPRLLELALRADDELYPDVLAVGQALVAQGATSVLTTCGYFTPYQERLARDLPVPVITSSLILLPLLENLVSGKILVLAADGPAVDERCLAASGITRPELVTVVGFEGPGPFRTQVLERGVIDDPDALIDQIVAGARAALAADPQIQAICLECGDMTLATPALRAAVRLPVVDYLTAGGLLGRAIAGVDDTVRQ